MSAPDFLMMSSGETTLPSDLDILRPSPSTMKPCVSTASNGAAPYAPTLVSSDDWNQPRCWSEPSRYMFAGLRSSGRVSSTLVCEQPDSNHTSTMSVSGLSSVEPQRPHAVPAGRYSLGDLVNQASAPSVANSSSTAEKVSGVATVSPHTAHSNTGIGTPQARWRLMHQSGRSPTMPPMRLIDQPGNPLDAVDLAHRGLAQVRRLHRDEPLVGRAEDDRLLAAPAVRIAVRDLGGGHKRAALAQPLDDDGIRVVDRQPLERAAAAIEHAVVVDRHRHRQVELHADQVVVLAVTGRRVDRAGAGREFDVVAGDDDAGQRPRGSDARRADRRGRDP